VVAPVVAPVSNVLTVAGSSLANLGVLLLFVFVWVFVRERRLGHSPVPRRLAVIVAVLLFIIATGVSLIALGGAA
jgi:hypothetical protein